MAAKRKCKYGKRSGGKCPTKAQAKAAAAKKRKARARLLKRMRAAPSREFTEPMFSEQDARDFIANTPASITVRGGVAYDDDTGKPIIW